MRILGIDPGYHRCGFAVVTTGERQPDLLGSGTITTKRGDALPVRLHALALELDRLILEWQPDCLAVEELYFAKNVKTGIGVAQARGVVLEHSAAAGLPVAEYAPSVVKSQLTGNGQADKQQIAFMVGRWFKLDDQSRLDDELDAIAVALCHAMRASIPDQLR
ncbi:crossover junction endodeoxyribonuclease RuvC [bacterium]|nr:crossover junction endodeoxyribonuclease RuvC [bacterium]